MIIRPFVEGMGGKKEKMCFQTEYPIIPDAP